LPFRLSHAHRHETACGTITAADAELIEAMWTGPRGSGGQFLWYGLERGAPLQTLNNSVNGVGQPFFRDSGGKVLFWHGTADPLIPFRGSVDYYDRLRAKMGSQVDRFARFFVAPGVGHCAGGQGAAPANLFDALVRWVEQGKAPDQLAGQLTDASGNVILTRPVCRYPEVARYKGQGSPAEAKNFVCAKTFR